MSLLVLAQPLASQKPESAQQRTAPRIAGLRIAEAKEAVDSYAAVTTAMIEDLARKGEKRLADRADARLDEIQDLVLRGELGAAQELLDSLQAGLTGSMRRRFFPQAAGALAAVLLSHAAGEQSVPEMRDRATFERLSYQGTGLWVPGHLEGTEFVKFLIQGTDRGDPRVSFIDTVRFRSHSTFMRAIGVTNEPGRGTRFMLGALCYRPLLAAPDGTRGLYTFEYGPNDLYRFPLIKMTWDKLLAHAPILRGKLAYHPLPRARKLYEREKRRYDAAKIPIFDADDVFGKITFLPLNGGVCFGRLRLMERAERPSPRDVVLYRTLPSEMPRVAGILTAERQTPLSHVNLRAVQDGVPNAYVAGAATDATIAPLIGKHVRYEVTASGYTIRAATAAEVAQHFAAVRPKQPWVPRRDLTAKRIRPLDELGFQDSRSVGVKAANLAVLRKLGFPPGTVPRGFAVPFSFYEGFMRHNRLDAEVAALLRSPDLRDDAEQRAKALAALRAKIAAGKWPRGLRDAIGEVQKAFPEGTRIRCRSSTNSEDLPGFSGAGLYASFTHKQPDAHLAETIRKVYASLWSLRAFEERGFFRIDHGKAAMGVLLHPRYAGEKANGVAVADDIVYQSPGRRYYVNVQAGEDMVTNPEGASVPEELLLSPSRAEDDVLVRASNRVEEGERLLGAAHREELRRHLGRIQRKFRRLYGRRRSAGKFAMEIEFKVTAAGRLAIKQARPWVY